MNCGLVVVKRVPYPEPNNVTYDGAEHYGAKDSSTSYAYELSGEMIRPEYSRTPMKPNGRCMTRYRNPSEGIALDFSEIRFFNDFQTRNVGRSITRNALYGLASLCGHAKRWRENKKAEEVAK